MTFCYRLYLMRNLAVRLPATTLAIILTSILLCMTSCAGNEEQKEIEKEVVMKRDTAEYFLLRPGVEKAYGYSHAVKIGDEIRISGAVSMDEEGNPTATGDMEQQMKNCYEDLRKVLEHFGCSFDDVIVENIFTTDMPQFLEVAAYRNQIYTNHFPTGSWLGVKALALPEFMIEIELEVYISE